MNELYFHINNGGVTFSVEGTPYGPQVVMAASHFGHDTARSSVRVTPEGLRQLAEFFDRQAARTFAVRPDGDYDGAARTLDEGRRALTRPLLRCACGRTDQHRQSHLCVPAEARRRFTGGL